MANILLDTTYLLPILGVKVNLENYESAFPKLLNAYTALYNPISLVEAKWIILRLCRENPGKKREYLKAYRRGLEALLNNSRLWQTELTNPSIEEIADQLVEEGVKDYFDRIIYATATHLNTILLTEDKELAKIAAKSRYKPLEVANWRNMLREIENTMS